MKKIIPAIKITSCGECPCSDYSWCTHPESPENNKLNEDHMTIPSWCPLENYQGWVDKPDSEGLWFSKNIYGTSTLINDVWKSTEGLKYKEFGEIFSNGHVIAYDDEEAISKPLTSKDCENYKWHKATMPEEHK